MCIINGLFIGSVSQLQFGESHNYRNSAASPATNSENPQLQDTHRFARDPQPHLTISLSRATNRQLGGSNSAPALPT